MNRRSFIKALGVLAATPALAKYLNVFKSAPIREGIAKGTSMGMDFFNSVIKKVMDEGTQVGEADRIVTFKHPDRADILIEVDKGTGSTTVLFEADSGTKSMGEIVTTADETTGGKAVSELFEGEEVYGPTGIDVQEGITGGITNLEEFIKKRKFASGGRVELARGGLPRALQAALKAIKSKFGDDAVMNANSSKRKLNKDELEDFEMEIGGDNLEAYSFDGTIGDAKRILQEEKQYMDDMFLEYKKGNLDPVAGDKSPARKRFLEKKFEEMEASGDSRLMTRDEIEELSTFDLGTEMDNFVSAEQKLRKEFPGISDDLIKQILFDDNPQRIAEVKQTMREGLKMQEMGKGDDEILQILKNIKRTKQAHGGIIGLTNNPRSANNKAGVETLFKGR
jgi:hypothetical protein